MKQKIFLFAVLALLFGGILLYFSSLRPWDFQANILPSPNFDAIRAKQKECEDQGVWFIDDVHKGMICENPASYGYILMDLPCMPVTSANYHFYYGPYANRTMFYRRQGSCDPANNPAICDISDGSLLTAFSAEYWNLSQQFLRGENCEYTPSQIATGSCEPGSASLTSPDGSNTCTATWSRIYANQTVDLPGAKGSVSNGGYVNATCANGSFTVHTATCPNGTSSPPGTRKSCPAGSDSMDSPNRSNRCTASWESAPHGTTVSLPGPGGTMIGGGTLRGTCQNGSWQADVSSISCPDL